MAAFHLIIYGRFWVITEDPTDSRTLYVGTFKRGIFKSTNGGESWQPTGLCEQADATACSEP